MLLIGGFPIENSTRLSNMFVAREIMRLRSLSNQCSNPREVFMKMKATIVAKTNEFYLPTSVATDVIGISAMF